MAGANKDKGEATDVLGAMVAAVPVLRAAVWVLQETQNKQGSGWTVDQQGPGRTSDQTNQRTLKDQSTDFK